MPHPFLVDMQQRKASSAVCSACSTASGTFSWSSGPCSERQALMGRESWSLGPAHVNASGWMPVLLLGTQSVCVHIRQTCHDKQQRNHANSAHAISAASCPTFRMCRMASTATNSCWLLQTARGQGMP